MDSQSHEDMASPFSHVDYHIGSDLCPVRVLPYQYFNRSQLRTVSTAQVISAQVRCSGINPIGLVFKPLKDTCYEDYWIWTKENINEWLSSDMPPGTYPLHRPKNARDLLHSVGEGEERPARICRLEKSSKVHEYVANLDLFLKIFLADVWGFDGEKDEIYKVGPSSETISSLGCADVHSLGLFIIQLPPLIGHRDFIRIVLCKDYACSIDPATSILLDEQPLQEHDLWEPHIGKPTRRTVTYIVVPKGNHVDSPVPHARNEHGTEESQSKRLNGIYVTCSVAVKTAYDREMNGQNYFEYVLPSPDKDSTKRFFLPFWTGIVLPISVAVRFSSNDIFSVDVLSFLHEYKPSNLTEPVSTLEQMRTEKSNNVPERCYPFPFTQDTYDAMMSASHGHKFAGRMRISEGSHHHHKDIYVGVVPVFKTIENVELRRIVLEEVENERKTGRASQVMHGDPSLVWPNSQISDEMEEGFSRFSISSELFRSPELKIGNIPVLDIDSFIKSEKLDPYKLSTGLLQDMPIKKRNIRLDSDSE